MMIHTFKPSRYYNTIGWHEPALLIHDGDTVITSCVCAAGMDEHEKTITQRPNPMSGPFYIEGAQPGDTLAVTFDRITPNRPFGWTRNVLAQNVVDPDYVHRLPDRSAGVGRWQADVAAGTATLVSPETKLGTLSLPLNPMVGCFGVAPALGQAISTATSAEHGGNMDYNGFVAGVTVYFAVNAPGALFHLGDVHAVQGDGEISGTGIEISSEIQFTVRVLKDTHNIWPRGENVDYIFTCGNARPLDQALQHATTEMSRWLMADYGLDGVAVGLLMGQAVKYEIGNVFDPAYTVVCKMPKKILAQFTH
ncbi:MAG: acetamidase/formamidase family protein [Chloroflexi bacterium]|nr:acetamidase/formamidase family protein [Chloroflexota bacterium]